MLKFLNGFDSLAEQCRKAKPFVKWAGGKGQLLGQLAQLLPAELANRAWFDYREPFVGGGAMLFFMLSHFPNIRKAVINDLNKDLIITYKAILGFMKLKSFYC